MDGPSIRDLEHEARRRRFILGEGAPEQTQQVDRDWASAHPMGYGSVETPGAFGHDRDVFDREHPGYHAPDEAPPAQAHAPMGVRDDWARADHDRPDEPPPSHDMGNLPTGGDTTDSHAQVEQSQAQDAAMPGSGESSLGQLMDMLSTYAENSSTSDGT